MVSLCKDGNSPVLRSSLNKVSYLLRRVVINAGSLSEDHTEMSASMIMRNWWSSIPIIVRDLKQNRGSEPDSYKALRALLYLSLLKTNLE